MRWSQQTIFNRSLNKPVRPTAFASKYAAVLNRAHQLLLKWFHRLPKWQMIVIGEKVGMLYEAQMSNIC